MKILKDCTEKEVELIYETVINVLLPIMIIKTDKNSIEQNDMNHLIYTSFNICCFKNKISTSERVKLLPIIASLLTTNLN